MVQNALIDTNILVYIYDNRYKQQQAIALYTLRRLRETSKAYLSVKTLSEFFVAMRRIPDPLSVQQTIDELEKYVKSFLY